MSDVPSVVTLVDLLTKISLVASAAVALVTSAAKPLVKVVSAEVALVTSAAKALFMLLAFVST